MLANLDGRAAVLGRRQHRSRDAPWTRGLSEAIGKRTWGINTRSPVVTPMGSLLPSLSRPPGPTARTLASLSSLTLDSGRKMPLAVLASALMRWTRTRSSSGTRDLMDRMEVACPARTSAIAEEAKPELETCARAPWQVQIGGRGVHRALTILLLGGLKFVTD
jgi:hypothetical protein